MNVGEIVAGVRLDDGQVRSSAPQVERILDRLDQTVARLAESVAAASGDFERFGSATQRTAGSIGSTATAVAKAAGAVGLAALAIRNSSINVGAAAGAFDKMSGAVKSAWASVTASTSKAADAVKASVGKINASVIKPSAGPFKSFVHNFLSLSHLLQFAVVFSFKTMAKNVGQILTGMSASLGAGIIGAWAAFAATVGKGAIQVAGDMEVIHQRLVVLTGSAEKAEEKLSFFKDLAGRSQFNLTQLVDAGTQLEVLGVNAEAMLPLVGDLAGAMGRDIETMSLAVGRSLKGIPEGWEMLRNQAGITAEKVAKYGAIINKQGGIDLSSAKARRAAAIALVQALKETEGSMALKAKGIQGSMAKVGNAVYLLQQAIGDALAPVVKSVSLGLAELINRVTDVVTGMDAAKSSVLNWIASLSVGGLAISGLGVTIGTAVSVIGGVLASFLSVLTAVGVGAGVLSFVLGGLTAAVPALGAVVAPVVGFLTGLQAVIWPLEAAIVAIGVAIGTVLLGAFLVGSAAIAAFAVAWAKNWRGIRERTAEAMEVFKNVLVNGSKAAWDAAVHAWNAGIRVVTDAAEGLWSVLEPAIDAVVDLFRESWPEIRAIVAQSTQYVATLLDGLIRAHETMAPVLREHAALWKAVWYSIRDVVQAVWPVIKVAVKAGLAFVAGAFSAASLALRGEWQEAWDAIVEGTRRGGREISIALNEALVSALREAFSFVSQFGLVGQAIGEQIYRGILGAQNRVGSLRHQQMVANWSRGDQTSSAWDAVTGYFSRLGQAPKQGPSAPPKSDAESEFQKWWKEFLERMGRATEDPGKKSSTPSEAEIERRNRALLVAAARSRVGVLHVEPNQCAVEARRAVEISGVAGPGPYREVAPVPLDAAALPPGAPYGPAFADSLPGTFFRDLAKVKAGDWVVFRGTSPDAKGNQVSHVGTVVEVLRDGDIRMVDASSAAAAGTGASSRVVERSIREFRPEQLLGFVEPKFFGGGADLSGAGGDFSKLMQDQQRLAEFVRQANEFESQRLKLEADLREVYDSARNSGATPDVFTSLREEGERRLAEIDRHEQESRQALRDEWLRGALVADSKDPILEVLDAVQGLEKARTDILDRLPGMAAPEAAQAQQVLQSLSGVEQFRAMIPALLEGQSAEVDRIMAALDALPDGNEVRRVYQELRDRQEAALEGGLALQTEPEAERWAQARTLADEAMAAIERRRALQRVSVDEEIAARRKILDEFRGSEADKESMMIAQAEREKERLVQRLTLNGDYNQAELAQLEEHLLAKGELLASGEAMLAAVRSARADLNLQEQQAHVDFLAQVESSFQQFLVQTMSAQQGFSNVFKSLWNSLANAVIAEISRMIIKTAAFQAVLKGLSALLGGIFGFHTGGVVQTSGVPYAVAHTGGLVVPGGVQTFHTGGMVGLETRPDEVLAKLQVGEVVLSRRQVREARKSGPTMQAAPVVNIRELHSHGPQDVVEMARTLGRRMAFYTAGA